jgi:hypothetical protein
MGAASRRKASEDLPGHIFEDIATILFGEKVDRLDEWLGVIKPLTRLRILIGTGPRILRGKHAPIGAADLEQKLKRLLIVQDRIEVELLQETIEPINAGVTTE